MDFELARGDPTLGLPCAHGGPVLCGALRAVPEDFLVTEQLGERGGKGGVERRK